jgi:hypothetical protein
MTLDEFKALAETWGADIGRWPEHLQPAAAMLVGTSEGAAILADTSKLDRLIIAAKPHVSAGRVDQAMFNVLAIVADSGHRKALSGIMSPRCWLVPAASIACAAILGTWVGIIKPLETSRHRTILTMVLDAGTFDPDWLLR